jgi:hypothetical protein
LLLLPCLQHNASAPACAFLGLQAPFRIRSAAEGGRHLQIRSQGATGAVWGELCAAVSRCSGVPCCCWQHCWCCSSSRGRDGESACAEAAELCRGAGVLRLRLLLLLSITWTAAAQQHCVPTHQ